MIKPGCNHLICPACIACQRCCLPRLARLHMYICYECGHRVILPAVYFSSVLDPEQVDNQLIQSDVSGMRDTSENPSEKRNSTGSQSTNMILTLKSSRYHSPEKLIDRKKTDEDMFTKEFLVDLDKDIDFTFDKGTDERYSPKRSKGKEKIPGSPDNRPKKDIKSPKRKQVPLFGRDEDMDTIPEIDTDYDVLPYNSVITDIQIRDFAHFQRQTITSRNSLFASNNAGRRTEL